jgi:hypothetical protein
MIAMYNNKTIDIKSHRVPGLLYMGNITYTDGSTTAIIDNIRHTCKTLLAYGPIL